MNNPELRRQFWLEITVQRLLMLPAILALLVLTVVLTSDGDALWASLSRYAQIGFTVITVFWGAKQISDSMNDELVDGSWDAQRISGLSAGQMTIGKLFGAASYAWYGGLWLLAIHICAELLDGRAANLLPSLLNLIAAALLIHGLALNGALFHFRTAGALNSRRSVRGGVVLLIFLVFPMLTLSRWPREETQTLIEWWALSVPLLSFLRISLLAFAGWALVGAYRNMRRELQFRNQPWVWLAFLVFLLVYCCGFITGSPVPDEDVELDFLASQPLLYRLSLGTTLLLVMSYIGLLTEHQDPVHFIRLVADFKARQWRALREKLPLWSISFALAVVLSLVLMSAMLVMANQQIGGFHFAAGTLAFLLFAVRDIALVLWCYFAKIASRAKATALVYLAVLYLLLPMVLAALGGKRLIGLLLPYPAFEQPLWLIIAVAWAAVALHLLRRRWRKMAPQPAAS